MRVLNHLTNPPDSANMLRNHISRRFHEALIQSKEARQRLSTLDEWLKLQKEWKRVLHQSFPPELFSMKDELVSSRILQTHQREGYRIETVIFESLWGWEVNAHICVPDGNGPFPAVVFPTGHSTKVNSHYQIPPVIFALNGFIGITFDSPFQGEKIKGNDHFSEGTACTLTGLWSETFFLMDALRAIDYLASRDDVDMTHGVGMSGVSGGGQTTMVCAALDDRITCIAPVCSTGSQRLLAAEEYYTSCPETLGKGLIKHGIDLMETLACAAPVPCLMVSGEKDELYSPTIVREFVEQVEKIYALYGMSERCQHFEQKGVGHSYTARMAEEVLVWMQKWLHQPRNPITMLENPESCLEPPEVISCFPDTKINMYSINLERAIKLEKERSITNSHDVRRNLEDILHIESPMPLVYQVLSNEMAWWHRFERVVLITDPEIYVPALFIANTLNPNPAKCLLWVDDRGKWEALKNDPWLQEGSGFLDRDRIPEQTYHLFLVDSRGWGETAPENVAYDLTWWNDINRILAYMSVALDDSLMGQRTRDTLAALQYLRTRPDVDPDHIVLGGSGAGAIVALFAAIIDGNVAGLLTSKMPASYRTIIEQEEFSWTHDVFVPDLLTRFDLPDLIRTLNCPVNIYNPVDSQKTVINLSNGSPAEWLLQL